MARHTGRRALLAGGIGFILGGGSLMAAAGKRVLETEEPQVNPPVPTPAPVVAQTPAAPPPFDLAAFDGSQLVALEKRGWWSWALVDHTNGAVIGSKNVAEVARTCSVIKVWLAADYLRTKNPSQTKLASLSKMIRYSDNAAATLVFAELGKTACFKRMQEICKLTDFKPSTSWGTCQMSARDIARLGAAVTAGTAAGPKWTEWLLNEMRLVKLGTWGIREAFPVEQASALAIKNGWDTTSATQTKHMNCLATTPRWTLVTMTKYPLTMPDRYGQQTDKEITEQLLKRDELKPLFGQ